MQEDQNEAQTESIPGTEELLRQAELLVEEHKEAWRRAKAETEDVRKRAQLDIANAHKYAVENFSTELLAVKDSLEKAISVENATMEAMKDGIELTLKQLKAVFTKFNLEEIDPAGQKFDPHQHQAISAIDSKEAPNTVVQVLQKGYKLNDRIIRPALVIVSKSA